MSGGLQQYEIVSTIGSGSYGICKKIKRKKDGKILVWKELDYGSMTETEKSMLVSEVNLLRELKHKYIVRYYDRIIDRSTTTLYIIMEYCEGGDLATYINDMKKEGRTTEEAFVWKICYQVVSALKECHSRSKTGKTILHRDLKPANVFLDTNTDVKLGDFGLARVLNHDTSFAKTFVGTPYYMSPEQMNYMCYNEKSDVWSLGCLLYELCVYRPPFTASNQRELASRICTGQFIRLPKRYSDDLNEFISYMLQVDEIKRPTIEKLSEHQHLLKHLPDGRSSTDSDRAYSQRLDQLKRRESRSLDRETLLQDKEKNLVALEKNLKEKERQLQEKEGTLRQKEKDLNAKEKSVVSKEKSMVSREMELCDKLSRLQTRKENLRRLSSPRGVADGDQYREREPREIVVDNVSDSGIYSPFTGNRSSFCPDPSFRPDPSYNSRDISDKLTRNGGTSSVERLVRNGSVERLVHNGGSNSVERLVRDGSTNSVDRLVRNGSVSSIDNLLADYEERKKSNKVKSPTLASPLYSENTPKSENYSCTPKIMSGRYKRCPLGTIGDSNREFERRGSISSRRSSGASPGTPQIVLKDRVLKFFNKSPPEMFSKNVHTTVQPTLELNI